MSWARVGTLLSATTVAFLATACIYPANPRDGVDLGWKPGALRQGPSLPGDDWRWRLSAGGGVMAFGGDLDMDATPFGMVRLSAPLRGGWELEVPVKVACPSLTFLQPRQIPGPNPNDPPQIVHQNVTQDGAVILGEFGVRRHFSLGRPGGRALDGSLGAGAGFAAFRDLGDDETAPSGSLSGALEWRLSNRFRLFLEGQAHGVYTDFGQQGDKSVQPIYAFGIGASWDL